MRDQFVIVRSSDGFRLEGHPTRESAERALKIVNDHEENNGRGPNYWRIIEEQHGLEGSAR